MLIVLEAFVFLQNHGLSHLTLHDSDYVFVGGIFFERQREVPSSQNFQDLCLSGIEKLAVLLGSIS
jgi:hypothetical protein